MTNLITDFYEAKKALDAVRGIERSDRVLEALGYPKPEPILDGRRKVKVYFTDGSGLLGHGDNPYRGARSVLSADVEVAVVATSKKDAVARVGGPGYAARLTREVLVEDYRYMLAASNPDKAVATIRGDEFGEPLLIDLSSAE